MATRSLTATTAILATVLALTVIIACLQSQSATTSLAPHNPVFNESMALLIRSPSFFDCNKKDSSCRYFYPDEFWKNDGALFANQSVVLGGSNLNLPALTGVAIKNSSKNSYLPSQLAFAHVHKCGGTTMQASMFRLARQLKRHAFEATVTTYKHSFGGGGTPQQRIDNDRARSDYIEVASNMFALVRNPVERFLSAVQQVMHYNDDFRSKCLHKYSAKATIQCAIRDMNETAFRHDVHFLPMVTHFRLLRRVSVFRMPADIPALLYYLQQSSSHHARNRHSSNYATSSVLAQMTVKHDCTANMIRAICDLYAVDVAFLTSLGFADLIQNCVGG